MRKFFPMGGTGKRFRDAGYPTPKPLLELHGKRLIQWAIESTSLLEGSYHYSPTLDVIQHPAFRVIPVGCWHIVLASTTGPLQTLLEAEGCLRGVEEELLICDCDSAMNPQELAKAVEVFRLSGAEGGVTVRQTTDPYCSFAEFNAEWWVSQTREKDPFTSWSTTGPYWFRSADQFWRAAQKAAHAHHVSISPVYNYLAGRTKAVPVESFQHWGTPAEYEAARSVSVA